MFYSIINIQQKIKYLWSSYKGDKKEIEIDRILITIEVYKSDYLFFLFFFILSDSISKPWQTQRYDRSMRLQIIRI